MSRPLFEVRNLSVAVLDADAAAARVNHGFTDAMTGKPLGAGWVAGIDDVSFSVERGEVLALVGESGMGKTLAVMAALGLLNPTARMTGGQVLYDGERFDPARLVGAEEPKKRWWRRRNDERRWLGESLDPVYVRIMGNNIGIIFQDPVGSWDPLPFIGEQAGEVLQEHSDMTISEIEHRVFDLLGEVRLPREKSFFSFAQEMSRGEAQRAMLAAALINGPSLLVADEPFTGLDPPVAQGIVELIRDMQRRRGLAVIMVNHDLAQVASLSGRVGVVYGGRIVEEASVDELYRRPRHPYSEGLLGSIPWPGVTRLRPIAGETPRLVDVARDHCSFAERCAYALDECRLEVPPAIHFGDGHAECLRARRLELRGVTE